MHYKNLLIISVLFAAVFIVHYVFLSMGPDYNEYIADNISINSRSQTALLALVYTLGRGIVLLAGMVSIVGMFYLMKKRYFFVFGGILCILTGIIALFALFMVTSSAEINKFIHIIIIASSVIVLGFVFIYAQFKNKETPGN